MSLLWLKSGSSFNPWNKIIHFRLAHKVFKGYLYGFLWLKLNTFPRVCFALTIPVCLGLHEHINLVYMCFFCILSLSSFIRRSLHHSKLTVHCLLPLRRTPWLYEDCVRSSLWSSFIHPQFSPSSNYRYPFSVLTVCFKQRTISHYSL